MNKENTRRNAALVLFPYYQKHFTTKFLMDGDSLDFRHSRIKIGIPNNYTFLIKDPEFETLVVEAIDGRANFLRDFERTIHEIETCLSQINSYLKN